MTESNDEMFRARRGEAIIYDRGQTDPELEDFAYEHADVIADILLSAHMNGLDAEKVWERGRRLTFGALDRPFGEAS